MNQRGVPGQIGSLTSTPPRVRAAPRAERHTPPTPTPTHRAYALGSHGARPIWAPGSACRDSVAANHPNQPPTRQPNQSGSTFPANRHPTHNHLCSVGGFSGLALGSVSAGLGSAGSPWVDCARYPSQRLALDGTREDGPPKGERQHSLAGTLLDRPGRG